MGGMGRKKETSKTQLTTPSREVSPLRALRHSSTREDEPLVSVSMITFRHENYIKDAIIGVLLQETTFPIEAVISNDNSPDATDAIINDIIRNNPRAGLIRYIQHRQNLGIMANALHNLERCRGKYIAFCEGDDCWTDPYKLQKQVDELQRNPDSDLCFHPAYTCYGNQRSSEMFGIQASRKKHIASDEVFAGGGDFCPTASVLIRREVFEKLKFFLASAPVGDYFLQSMGSLRGGAIYLPEPMCIYRKGTPFSWTADMQSVANREAFFWLIFDSLKQFDYFLNHSKSKPLNIEIERQFLHLSLTYLKQGLLEKYQALYEAFARRHTISTRIAILHAIGLKTQSESFTREFDRWTFAKPNPLSRAIRRCSKILSEFTHQPRSQTVQSAQPAAATMKRK
jgi:glycosyltransferase involved in cell wall biosynthesis